MKTKMLYAVIFVLAVIIMLTLIYTRGKITELNPLMPEIVQVEVKQPEGITPSSEPVFFSKQAITVIKPAQGKQVTVSELDEKKDLQNQQESGLVSQSSSAASGEAANTQNAGEAAGVTRLGKYPTKEEMKEMNSKGIVMY